MTANRPLGVGVSGLPTATVIRRRARSFRRTTRRRAERSMVTLIRVRHCASELSAGSTQPSLPLGRCVVTTPSQRPRRAETESVVGEPNSVCAPRRATTGPPGREWTTMRCPGAGLRTRKPGSRRTGAAAAAGAAPGTGSATGSTAKTGVASAAAAGAAVWAFSTGSGDWRPDAGRAMTSRIAPTAARTATTTMTCGGR